MTLRMSLARVKMLRKGEEGEASPKREASPKTTEVGREGGVRIQRQTSFLVDLLSPAKGRSRSHKYNASRTVVDGISFASKLEAKRYEQLEMMQKLGELWFIRQPAFDLGGGVTYRADFLVVQVVDYGRETRVHAEDCKGFETEAFKIKKRLMADRYPHVNLKILTKKDIG